MYVCTCVRGLYQMQACVVSHACWHSTGTEPWPALAACLWPHSTALPLAGALHAPAQRRARLRQCSRTRRLLPILARLHLRAGRRRPSLASAGGVVGAFFYAVAPLVSIDMSVQLTVPTNVQRCTFVRVHQLAAGAATQLQVAAAAERKAGWAPGLRSHEPVARKAHLVACSSPAVPARSAHARSFPDGPWCGGLRLDAARTSFCKHWRQLCGAHAGCVCKQLRQAHHHAPGA